MFDFTIETYKTLIAALITQGYTFQTFADFLNSPAAKVIILRHDVDARKENSLRFAEIQYELGIQGSYYFRVVPESFSKEIIEKIAAMGHEVGYHYETMDTVSEKLKVKSEKYTVDGLIEQAYEEFCHNLEMFRKIVPVKTICMHGSPRSKYDNKDIWKKYSYKSLDLTGEPYFDINFNQVAYLTDTGRRWNGDKVSVRDKVQSKYAFNFRSTSDILKNLQALPDQVMLTFHPQRWHSSPVLWTRELLLQNLKNQVKYILLKTGR